VEKGKRGDDSICGRNKIHFAFILKTHQRGENGNLKSKNTIQPTECYIR
jgi:hypothetical protein